MDPKVCGKLLTHHRRGYGVDVEALRDRFPLRQIAGKGPKMGSHGYRRLRRWKVVSWLPLMFLGYKSINRQKSTSVELRGAHEGGCAPTPWARPPASWSSRLQLQVFWIAFGPRKIIAKVSFRLDSVWYSFSAKLKIWGKQKLALGSRLIG